MSFLSYNPVVNVGYLSAGGSMLASIEVLRDGSPKQLLFDSEESARSFLELIRLYQVESGAGNGYGAYWAFSDMVELTDGNSGRFTIELDGRLVNDMIESVARARSGGGAAQKPTLTIGREGGGIKFSLGEFAPRITPAAGDMFRVVDREFERDEGRVLEVEGADAKVITCWAEESDGSLNDRYEPYTIPRSAIMKIPDWKLAHRKASA